MPVMVPALCCLKVALEHSGEAAPVDGIDD
jgi:hypothetical protein